MTGIPHFNFPEFEEAAETLRHYDKKHEFLSPAELDSAESRIAAELNNEGDPVLYEQMTGETWGDLLSRDVKLIADKADGVVVLDGWEDSKGARLEVFVAATAGKPIYGFEVWDKSGGCDSLADDPKYRVSPGALASAFEDVGWNTEPEPICRVFKVPSARVIFRSEGDPLRSAFTGRTAKEAADRLRGTRISYSDYSTEAPDLFEDSESGEVRTVSATGGEKGMKPERLDLIPPEFLEELGRVFGEGAKKYSDNNYLKGYEYRKSLGAMLRHIMRFAGGEDIDRETGCHHLAHAAWHCSTLYTFQREGLGEDDRLFKAIEESL